MGRDSREKEKAVEGEQGNRGRSYSCFLLPSARSKLSAAVSAQPPVRAYRDDLGLTEDTSSGNIWFFLKTKEAG